MIKRRAVLVLAILLSAVWIQPSPVGSTTMDRIVAVVNGDIITASDLRSAAALAGLGLLSLSPDGTSPRSSLSEREILDQLINQRLQLQMAHKKGITVGPEEVERAVEDVKQKNGMTTDAALIKGLQEEHSDLEQYKNGMRDQITIVKLVNREVKSGVVLSDEEIRTFYADHPDRFLTPKMYRLHQILLPISPSVPASSAEQTARSVVEQLRNGTDFSALVKRYPSGVNADDPGDLGAVRADQMLPEIRKAIEALAPGAVSEPIKTAAGILIFRLDEILPPRPRPIEEVRPEIQEHLFQERSVELYEKWLKDLRASAQVEVKF